MHTLNILSPRFLRDAEGKGGGGGSDDGKTGDENKEGAKGDGEAETVDSLKGKLVAIEAAKKAAEDEKAKLLKDTMKNKDKAKEAQAKLDALQAELAASLGEGTTLEDVKKLISERKTAEEEGLKAKGDFDSLKARLLKEHQKQVEELTGKKDSEITELKKGLEAASGQIRTLLVSNAFASSQFLSENLTLTASKAERLYGDHFKVEEKDGRAAVVAYIGGEPLVNAAGNALSFDEAFKEIVNRDPERDFIMKSKAKAGAGSGSDTKGDGKLPEPELRGAARINAALAAKAK